MRIKIYIYFYKYIYNLYILKYIYTNMKIDASRSVLCLFSMERNE